MKSYLDKLATDYYQVEETICSDGVQSSLKKITGRLLPGARCAWCYRDDVEFWKGEEFPYPHPKDWPYQGFIMPFPNTNGRSEMELEHVCLVTFDYPIEKENPETDWSVLAALFKSEDLHRFYVFEPIVLANK